MSISSLGPISDTPLLRIRTSTGSSDRPADARVLKPLRGFEFVAEGEVIDGPHSEDPSQLWTFKPREWDGYQLDGFTLKVLRMAISWPEAPLRFEWEWFEGQYVRGLPHVTRGGATPADYRRLASAFQALLNFTENLRHGGGRPIGTKKGRLLTAWQFWVWYRDWDPFGDEQPTKKDLAARLGVSTVATALKRLEDVGQSWPPTNPRRRKK